MATAKKKPAAKKEKTRGFADYCTEAKEAAMCGQITPSKPSKKSYTDWEIEKLIQERMPEPNVLGQLVDEMSLLKELDRRVVEAKSQLQYQLDQQATQKSRVDALSEQLAEISRAAKR